MSRVFVAAGALACLLAHAGAAAAAEPAIMPPFSAARDDASVMLWLRRNTSLRLGQAVVFGPDNVLVIAADTAAAGAPTIHRVSFRQEATQIAFVARTGGRSIRGDVEVDCASGKVRIESIALYAGSDLRGDQITSQGPDTEWRAPAAGAPAATVMGEACGQTRSAPKTLAAAPAGPPSPVRSPPPAPAPAAEAAAPPPARPPAAGAEAPTLAQVGAFDSQAQAEAAWKRLLLAFPAELAGKSVLIQPASVAGAQMFRTLIQGFASPAAARATCAALVARAQPCFVRRAP